MENNQKNIQERFPVRGENQPLQQNNIRWLYLAIGTVLMLFAGIIYAWSILKSPLAEAFSWERPQLALSFTLTMCFFCLGGMAGGLVNRRFGVRLSLILAAILAGAGFVLTSRLGGESVGKLYVSYGFLAGGGIGIAYNVNLSTIGAWFPDKKGLCSGVLMMGFGASALILGSLAEKMISSPSVGWRNAFLIIGIALCVVLLVSAFILRVPNTSAAPKGNNAAASTNRDYTTSEMVRTSSFWRAFVCLIFLSAAGSTVISFARDLVLSVGAEISLATTLVGLLSVCNGLGRITTGAFFDKFGRRKTMLIANAVTILAAGVTLLAVIFTSLPLCIMGLCATGFSYGSCPTISSVFTSEFFGTKYYAVNFSVMNFNLMCASFIAALGSVLLASSGGYVAPFVLLLVLASIAMVLNISIRDPK
ncbi:MFS transporter [Anaerotignum sp.]|uniref:MFS transporter n=1 Tax=Anaerotignum sp. TaxID=2039241 RepID=UPI002714795F|nr:MFS transporter [Anaerotignum sp.]